MEVLAQEMDRMVWHVLGISEMRWKRIREGMTEDCHKFWYSGNKRKYVHGVGFLVNKKCSKSVMGFTPVSERIAGKPFNLTATQVYALTSDYCDEIIEEFYDDFEKVIKAISRKDILVV